MEPYLIPLREKYRVKRPGRCGSHGSSNAGDKKKKGNKLRPRRKAYGPLWT